jgi:hypothetical protein
MQRRPKARSYPQRERDETDLTPELLMALRPALEQGMRRSGDFYIAAGAVPAVISVDVAQQLVAIGFARLDGDRLSCPLTPICARASDLISARRKVRSAIESGSRQRSWVGP